MNPESLFDNPFKISLPIGLVDDQGMLHREGVMRLTTGKDEYLLQDLRLQDNPGYGVLVMLSQVILCLGSLSPLTPELLEGLFLVDLNYLQEFYNSINPQEAALSLSGE